MNQTTYRMRRRVGAALLAGVSALGVTGVAALAGGGVANAATGASAALPSGAAATTIPGTGTSQGGTNEVVTINGTVSSGDVVVLTIACPATGTIAFVSGATASSTSTAVAGTQTWSPSLASDGKCGTGVDDQLVLAAPNGAATTTTSAVTTLTVTGIKYDLSGAAAGSVSLSGQYESLGQAAISFSVPSNATISWFGVTSNVPPVSTSGTGAQSVSNVTISQPAGLSGGLASGTDYLTMTATGANFSGTPTVSVVPTSAATVTAITASANTVVVQLGSVTPSVSANFTFSGLSIAPTTSGGTVTAGITFKPSAGSPTVMFQTVTLATQLASANRIYGQTADATVAAEFQAAFPVTGATHPTSVVLATDKDPYDALAAAYLESQLGTGLLITPPTTLGTDAMNALRVEGVSTVYVVGGPDAITPAVISQLQSTPAYNVGGVTETGSNLKVVGPIYGQTADDTAAAIATYFGTAYGQLPAGVQGAYSSTGGTYNNTTGNASATGPSSAQSTAFVIADTDWQDATTLGPIAYAYRLPIILTPAGSLGTQAQSALTSLGVKQVIVVGGQLALSNSVVTSIQALNGGISVLRIAGQTYSDTATQLAKFETGAAGTGLNWDSGTPKGFLISHGDYWSDALGAAAIGGSSSFSLNGTVFGYEPILTTVNPTTVGSPLTTYLQGASDPGASLNVLGGPLAVTSSVLAAIQTALAAG